MQAKREADAQQQQMMQAAQMAPGIKDMAQAMTSIAGTVPKRGNLIERMGEVAGA